jgi:hypothetical protein
MLTRPSPRAELPPTMNRLALQRGIIEHLDRRIEGVHVGMRDDAIPDRRRTVASGGLPLISIEPITI